MKTSAQEHSDSAGAGTLILTGLVLASLGAGSVALLVLGMSHLYVGACGAAIGELAGFLLMGGVFLASYGPYLDRLERWAPPVSHNAPPPPGPSAEDMARETRHEPVEPAVPSPHTDRSAADPLPTDIVVAVATLLYGLLIALGGLIWTRGADLAFNLIAAAMFVVSAGVVAWLGRRARTGGVDAEE